MQSLKTQLLLLILLAGGLTLYAQPEDLTIARAELLRANVVKLEVKYQDGGTGYGFGFVTNEQNGQLFMVTAAHVTHGPYFEQEPERIIISFTSTLQQKTAIELRWFEEEDLALLQLETPLGYQWQKDFSAIQAERYTPVRFFGDNFLIMNGGELIDVLDNRLRFNPSAVFPGISGAPLVSKYGIVGMITDDSRENASALSIRRIRDMLQLPVGDSPYFYERKGPIDDFVKITGGSFQMGDQYNDDTKYEQPVRTVRLDDFMMSPTEVSNAEIIEFLNAEVNQSTGGSQWYELGSGSNKIEFTEGVFQVKPGFANHPVMEFNWYGAVNFCNWKSEQAGLQKVYTLIDAAVSADWNANGYRLPTEAEWEYAAREAGRKVRFGNGEDIARSAQLNFDASELSKKPYSEVGINRKGSLEVNSLKKNRLGLFHMSGNVAEWCWDWYELNYYTRTGSSIENPKGTVNSSHRSVRGGSWLNDANTCRAAYRHRARPTSLNAFTGFRLVRNAG